MTKLIAFDLDDTLAPVGKGITQSNLAKLRTLEQRGIQIAVCSGKPTYYLCGFMRQAELSRPILLGENGAVVQIGVDLPPKDFYIQEHAPLARRSMDLLRDRITQALPQMWFQPNQVCLTPFPTTPEEHQVILDVLDACADELHDIEVYHHYDSFDILPKGISKRTGLEWIGRLLRVSPSETIAVGNGENDYPMFDYASVSVGVNVPDPRKVTVNFPTLSEALDFLLEER